ncbi:MAG: hydrolase [Verrucomicrobiae bacterium]|nr:hydrolase [Verrucomicrobiae bacterium]
MNAPRLEESAAGLLVVDVQERFAPVIFEWANLLARVDRLIRFFRLLRAPIGVTEQYPKGLGATVTEIREALGGDAAWTLAKTRFSSAGTPALLQPFRDSGRRQWVLCGIEAHVCVQQTALDLLAEGFEVFLPADAVSSRRAADRNAALDRLARAGAIVSTSESLIFEILRDATHPLFKSASALVKS